MHIFFDVDYTILEIDYGTLRPGVKDVFEKLVMDGHTVYVWSGVGARVEEVKALGLQDLVGGVFEKPWENYERVVEDMLTRGEIPVLPDLVVDDTAAIVRALGGILVRPYGSKGPRNDREMELVYRIIMEYTSDGHSSHPAFRPLSPERHTRRDKRALIPPRIPRS